MNRRGLLKGLLALPLVTAWVGVRPRWTHRRLPTTVSWSPEASATIAAIVESRARRMADNVAANNLVLAQLGGL